MNGLVSEIWQASPWTLIFAKTVGSNERKAWRGEGMAGETGNES